MLYNSNMLKCGLCVFDPCVSWSFNTILLPLASAPLFFRKCKCTCVCCVPAVLQSVWLLYSASAGVGRLLAETLWCSAHVISLMSLCVCVQMSAGFRLQGACEHTPETHSAHSCLDSTHLKPYLLFSQSDSLSPVGFLNLSVWIPLRRKRTS